MDDRHNPNDIENTDTNPEQPVSAPAPAEPQTKRMRPSLKLTVIIVATLLIGLGIGATCMYLYKDSGTDSAAKNTTMTSQTESDNEKQQDIKKEDSAIESQPVSTDDRPLYTDPSSKYSFRYPKSWSLTREVERNLYNENDSTEYEQITLKKGDETIIVLDYPFEMVGCGPSTKTSAYEFGDYSARMIDPCGGVPSLAGKQFMVLFENPKKRPSDMGEKEWPLLRMNYFTGVDGNQGFADFKEFAKSIDGLVPAQGYRE